MSYPSLTINKKVTRDFLDPHFSNKINGLFVRSSLQPCLRTFARRKEELLWSSKIVFGSNPTHDDISEANPDFKLEDHREMRGSAPSEKMAQKGLTHLSYEDPRSIRSSKISYNQGLVIERT